MEEQKKNPAQGLSESEQVQVRRQKLADLQAAGRDPFTLTKFPQDAYSADLKEEFKDLPNETDSGKKVALAGRLMSKRVMGKASFAHLRDDKGDIQLYVRRDELGDDAYAAFKKLDVGDIIGVRGEVFRTKTGELSARAEEITLLAKSLRPLPEKFHGLTDTEMRYRQRYVDLIANPEVKETFVKRSKILKEIRAYLDEKGFLEVDTPILTPFEIGASARPFYTHHNTLNMDMVLRIETELYLKRLIVGGMDRVYEVGRIFRNEGMDPKHNPEFTTIELYQAFTDFHGMMDLVEELYKRLAQKICGSLVIPYQGKQIDMGHWERLTMIEAVKKYSGVDFNDWKTDEDAIAAAKEHHVELPEVPTKGAILAEFFDAFVEDKLIQPTFIYDYPVEISPLAKRKPDDPAFTERFEYFIDCTEYGNAFSELNDPIDQKGRFERQVARDRLRLQGLNVLGRLRLAERLAHRGFDRFAALDLGHLLGVEAHEVNDDRLFRCVRRKSVRFQHRLIVFTVSFPKLRRHCPLVIKIGKARIRIELPSIQNSLSSLFDLSALHLRRLGPNESVVDNIHRVAIIALESSCNSTHPPHM